MHPLSLPGRPALGLPLLGLALALSACGTFSPDPELSIFGGGGKRVNSAGAHQLLEASFEQVDLVQLLSRGGLSAQQEETCASTSGGDAERRESCRLDAAFRGLHTLPGLPAAASAASGAAPDTVVDEAFRNAVQDRLIAASDQRCNVYLAYLQRHHAATSFTLGSLTTLLGGAGAVVSGVNTARALSGGASVISGTRAEYEQSYFLNSTTNMIAAGIRTRRAEIRDALDATRADTAKGAIGRYTVERAVADAMRYHGACSLIAGLEQTQITVNAHAGLETALKATNAVFEGRIKAAELAASAAAAEIRAADAAASASEARARAAQARRLEAPAAGQ